MKTRIFTYASLILSAAALLSCQKLEEVNEPLVAAGTHSVIVTTDATRTVNGDMHTYFEDGDKMTVIYRRSGSSNYHANEYTYSASSGQFTGSASLSSGNSYYWWGIYPYSSSNTKATSVSVSIPVSQTQVGNDSKAALAGEGFPLVGKTGSTVKGSTTPQFNVSNVATVLDFKITNGSATPLTVTKVEFTAPSGIAGTFSADLTQSTISWKAASSASKTVTLNVASGEAIANGAVAHFYAGAGPFSGAGSYTIEVTAKNAEGQTFVSSKTINGSLDCKSSTINTISHTFAPGAPVTGVTGYELVTSEPSDWSGRYILVSADKKLVFTGDNGTNNKYTLSSTDLSDGIITKDCSAYEFTITKSGSNYYLKNTAKNQYLYCDYSGNSNTGMSYSSSQRALNLEVQNDGTFGFWMRAGSTDQYIYYKSSSGYFKFGGSHDNHCVYLYKWTEGGTPDVPPTPSTDKTYKKVTSFTSGKHYVIAEGTNALKNNNGNIASASINGKVSGNTLTLTSSEAASLEWTATSSSVKPSQGVFTLNNGSSYLRRVSDTNAAQLAAYDSGSAGYFVWFLSGTGNNLYNVNSTGQYTFYLDYNNGWTANQQNATNAIVVYEEDGSTPATKQNQTLSFANATVEWTLGDTYKVGGTYDAQAVTGDKTTVTLTSSNPAVATISDGKIKIVDEGTTTIIANAAEDDTYYSASASYTLKISPAPVQPSTKTYTKVNSISEGTYIICGYESSSDKKGTYVCIFPPVTATSSSIKTTNRCEEYKFSDDNSISKITTDNASIIGSEVKITKSGSNWLVQYDGKYMYYNNSTIAFTTSSSSAAQSISLSSGRGAMKSGSQEFYHSGTDKAFGYTANKNASNLMFFKLDEGSTPATKQDQSLSFTKNNQTITSDSFTLGSGTYIAPTLIGAMTSPVTWTSSQTSVATVSNNGTVTIVGAGTTTITASAPASDSYNAASASYELTVSPAPVQPTTKTYTKVSSLSEGTYIICGYESSSDKKGTYVCLFPPVTATSTSIKTTNRCEEYKFSDDNSITKITTDNASIIGSEVKITKSGSNWLVQYDGKYMYYNNSTIAFTTSSSSAAQSISLSSGRGAMKSGSQEFYHSGTDKAFGYTANKNASNLMFFKLDEGSTPDTPTPSGSAFNLENDYLKAFLDAAERQYSNSTTSSIVSQYIGSSSGWGGVANDLPKPVTLSWTGSATSISIYEGTSATGSAVKTMNFTSSSSVEIFNLIPGKTYSFKTSNNQTGTFTTTGRRRMIKVSDTQSESHARNCRDLGGIQTRDGKTLKYGMIYRGTNVDQLTESEKKILHDELGIRLDQDLRNETSKTSSPIGSDVEFCRHGGYDANTIASQDGDNMKQSVLHVMNAVIEGRPVYFHCRIGSDRTGHMGMLYLALLGCDLKECDIDYEITSFASAMTNGTRTIGSGNEKSFRSKFIKSPYNNNSVPEAVENYVVNTLNISLDTVKKFRKAMGVSETLN